MKDQTSLNTVTKDGIQASVSFVGGRPGLVRLIMETGHQLWIPQDVLVERPDGRYYLPVDFAFIQNQWENFYSDETPTLVIPVVQEELRIEKQPAITGRVKIHKRVDIQEEVVDLPGFTEEVQVERVPVNQVIDAPVTTRVEGETLIIPLMEEVLVIEKRLLLREELHVKKLRKETRNPETVTLRREEAEVERIDEPREAPG